MKKSLLALAVVFAASSATASAATVYDKDGTTLSVGGRVQSVLFNGFYKKAGEKDSSLVNSARFNIAGNTKVNDYLSVLAFSEWDMADGESKNIGDNLVSREQYVGADFGSFGKLIAGKTLDSTRQVMAATDIFEYIDVQNDTGINGDRRNGLFRYDYNNNGLFASVTYETAADNQKIFGQKFDVQNGYAVALGYTFDNVVFGPLSIKAGFNFIDGQNDDFDGAVYNNAKSLGKLNNAKNFATSIAWGSSSEGLYLAALYYSQKVDFAIDHNKGEANKKGLNDNFDRKGYEFTAGYGFDNGIGIYTGYQTQQLKYKYYGYTEKDNYDLRRVPVQVKYTYNPNFKVWAEAEFDANSDDKYGTAELRGTEFNVGARYTF
ncbi:MAG: porin [Succinivibrio sp.]|nr:porin [Succinivibrio sp.]